jgi:hypothetical protein
MSQRPTFVARCRALPIRGTARLFSANGESLSVDAKLSEALEGAAPPTLTVVGRTLLVAAGGRYCGALATVASSAMRRMVSQNRPRSELREGFAR